MVVEYTYDAWGTPLTATGSLADTLGKANSLRYRGYVYDNDTGYYYLQTRYYNPELGRFINADGYSSTGQGLLGNNMFAYCLNNPITYTDPNGEIAIFDDLTIALCVVGVCAALLLLSPPVQETVYHTAEELTNTVSTVTHDVAQKLKKKNDKGPYAVYFLEDETGTVRYVGRVTERGLKQRLAYHEATRGLKPKEIIHGLKYEVARGLEEIGMIECHTLNTKYSIYNQIHGISAKYKIGAICMEAAFNYLENHHEETILNLFIT